MTATRTYFLDEHIDTPSWEGVWKPICTAIRRCLDTLGLTFDAKSAFRIYCHKNRLQRPDGTLFFMQMHLGGLYSMDHEGWGVTASQRGSILYKKVNETDALRFCARLRQEWLATGKSKSAQPPLSPNPLRGYVLVPLQMPDDSVIKNHSRVGVEEFVVRIAEWARKTRTNCVIKPHPGCRRESHPKTWTAISRATDGNEWALLRAENIHSLISHATGVFTINSGTGFEALVHGKPVVVFGEADYDHVTGKGALDSLGACVRYLREAPDLVAAQKFAAYYVRHQCFWLGIDQRAETRLYDYFSSYTRQMRSTS